MTKKSNKIIIDESYSKPPKKNYPTNKTVVYHIDDVWSLDILDLKDYGPQNIKVYTYNLVVFVNFSKFGWTIAIRNKTSITTTNSIENNLITLKRKANLIETDTGKEFYNNVFQNFLNNKNIKHCSGKTYLGAVSAERFNRTIRDLLKKVVFEKDDSNWVKILTTVTKQYNNWVHTSTNLTPIQASLKKNKGFAYKNLLNTSRRKWIQKFK